MPDSPHLLALCLAILLREQIADREAREEKLAELVDLIIAEWNRNGGTDEAPTSNL